MRNRIGIITLFTLLVLAPLARLHGAEITPAKPSIVFILADDLGCIDVGCFNPKQNLVHLIKTLRNDFDSPNARFVLATGCGNPGHESFGLQIAEARLAVDGDKGKYPEFKGNVKAIDTRDLWREADVSPVNQGHHYNHNAETCYETGERLGRAMAELLPARE